MTAVGVLINVIATSVEAFTVMLDAAAVLFVKFGSVISDETVAVATRVPSTVLGSVTIVTVALALLANVPKVAVTRLAEITVAEPRLEMALNATIPGGNVPSMTTPGAVIGPRFDTVNVSTRLVPICVIFVVEYD